MEDHIKANAELVLKQLRSICDPDFGYSAESVACLDGYIERLTRSGEFENEDNKNKLISVFGSFLGECIIRCYGGSWQRHDGVLCVVFDEKNMAFPFAKVAKQIDNGNEDGIASFFDVIPILFKDLAPPSTLKKLPVTTDLNPTSEQVNEARELLRQFLRRTRLVRAERIGRDTDAQVYLKLETDLPTGSFKTRGAIYALMKTLAQRSIKGVVAASTGNHGAAVAYAARLAQLPATIFLPESPNPVKRQRIIDLGANVKEVEWTPESLGKAAASFAAEHDYYFLDDGCDPLVPVGTATIAAEIFDELPAPDTIIVPMGDTALIRGVAAEAKRRHPGVRIVGVQAAQAPSYARSWREGRVVTTDTCNTIADGLATYLPLASNVHAIRELVDDVILVSEDEMLHGIRTLLFEEHIVAEAAGAAALAAFLQNSSAYANRKVVLLVTGSSIPHELLRQAATITAS